MTDSEKIVAVIAAFNEGSAIKNVINSLHGIASEVVVVDDGSTDQTAMISQKAGAIVARHIVNLGQGAALQTGIDIATKLEADYVVTFDADGQHDPNDISPAILALRTANVDIALGSRFLGKTVNMPRSKMVTLKLAVLFTSLTSGVTLTDSHNGFRVLTKNAANTIRLRHNRMAHASEFIEQIALHRLSYIEVPVTITYSDYSMAKGQKISNSGNIIMDLLMGRFLK